MSFIHTITVRQLIAIEQRKIPYGYSRDVVKLLCHNNFSNTEMRDIACVYAKASYTGRAAAQSYLQLYSNR